MLGPALGQSRCRISVGQSRCRISVGQSRCRISLAAAWLLVFAIASVGHARLAWAQADEQTDDLPAPIQLRAPREDNAGPRWTSARLRVALGSEWDTNARRAIQGADVESPTVAFPAASRPFEVVSDGLMRVVVDSAAGLRFGSRHALRGHYVLGAKRFFRETTEDLLVQEIGLASGHQVADTFNLGLDATYKGSRIRSGLRDYDVLTGGLRGTVRLGEGLTSSLQARLTRFFFAVEPRFDYWGPRATLSVDYRPIRRLSLAARGGFTTRFYDGPALVEAIFVGNDNGTVPPDGSFRLTFCDNPAEERQRGYACSPAGLRRDYEVTASISISYRGPFLLSGQYLLRLQRSNSDFENIDRHRFELLATFRLPLDLTVNIIGALQFNQGVSITDQKFLADADENQNSVNVGLQRPLGDLVYLEARYALFTNQFTAAAVTFFRHTVYLGLGYRGDLLAVSR